MYLKTENSKYLLHRDVFSTGAMGALAPAILKNRLLAPAIFGHFSTVGKNWQKLVCNLNFCPW